MERLPWARWGAERRRAAGGSPPIDQCPRAAAPARLAPMITTLRSPVVQDAASAAKICYEAFKTISERHGFPPDFPAPEVARGLFDYMLSRSDIHGVIAE